METYYYGISEDLEKCTELTNYLQGDIFQEASQFKYIIKKTKMRESQSGATIYYSFKILDNKLNQTTIGSEGCKLLGISEEYWWSIGSFDSTKAEIYFPGFKAPDSIDTSFCLYSNLLHWKIKGDSTGFKVCFIEFQDENGYKKLVPSSCGSADSIAFSLNYLKILAAVKSYTTFKLFILLLQLKSIGISTEEEKKDTQVIFGTILFLCTKSL